MLKILVIIAFILTMFLYLLLGIEKFKPNKKQLLALIPLLLLLFTINRLDIKLIQKAQNEPESNEPIVQEQIVEAEEKQEEIETKVDPVVEPKYIIETKKVEIPKVAPKEEVSIGQLIKYSPAVLLSGFLLPLYSHFEFAQ